MDKQADFVLRTIEERDIRFVRLWFTDVIGSLKSVAVAPAELEAAFSEGIGFDGSAIEGFARVYESDMLAKPDPATFQLLPWRSEGPGVARMFCDIQMPDGSPSYADPRWVLKRTMAKAADMGFTFYTHPEIEFYLFHESYREAFEKEYRGLSPHSPWMQDYQIVQTTFDEYVIGDIRRNLDECGIPVECSKGEAGRGQHEVNLRYAAALEMADRNLIYKSAAKEIAASHGRSVSFMAKWNSSETGSSCHVHSSLWTQDGTPAFDSSSTSNAMPELFQHYLAGLLATARDFSLLWAPTINSYRRFQPGSWAPTAIAWGSDNRTLGMRVVGHGAGARVECRTPGSDANSYLAFAGTLAGGMYGIRHKIALEPAFEGNGYEATNVPRIPSTLLEAIQCWENSSIALECFGPDVHGHILSHAKAEWAAFNRHVTDWELTRYFERS